MATLTKDSIRDFSLGDIEEYPVKASHTIYEGAAVGATTAGYSEQLTAGKVFQGFCIAKVDNSSGSAGERNVVVKTRGRVTLTVVGSALTANLRVAVYASDDNTFSTTATNNSLIGYVSRWISGTLCVVEFDGVIAKAAKQA